MSHAADRIVDLLIKEGIDLPDDRGALNRKIMAAIEQLPAVELHPASIWDCEHCGNENFVRHVSITTQHDPDTPSWQRDEEDLPPGMWCCVPNIVKCKECGKEFLVTEHDDDLGDDFAADIR